MGKGAGQTRRQTYSIDTMRDACKRVIDYADGMLKGEIPTEEEEAACEDQIRVEVYKYHGITDGQDARTMIETAKQRQQRGERRDVFSHTVNWTLAIMNGLNAEIGMSDEQRRFLKAAQFVATGERIHQGFCETDIYALPLFFRMLVAARLRARHCLEFTEGARRVTKRARSAFLDAIAASGAARTVGKYSKVDDINKHFPAEVKRLAHTVGVVLSEEDKEAMRISKARKAGLSHGMLKKIRDAVLSDAEEMRANDDKITLTDMATSINKKYNSPIEISSEGGKFEYVNERMVEPIYRLLQEHGLGRRKGGSN